MENFENLKNELLQKSSSPNIDHITLPHRRIETWKYTSLNTAFETPFLQSNIKDGSVNLQPTNSFYQICEINGVINYIDEEIKSSLNIVALKDIEDQKDISIINNDQYYDSDVLNSLNKADLAKGYILEIKKGIKLNKPIKINQYYFGVESYHTNNYIIKAGEGSEIELIHELRSQDQCMINSKYSFDLAKNSKINHLYIQDNSKKAYTFGLVNTKLDRDAHFHSTMLNLGSKLSRNNIYIELNGENALADTNGLFILDEDQHHDTNSYIKHRSPHSYSNQLFKGILADNSRGVFAGIIRIDQDAQLVNSTQLNKNLILSKKAQMNSRPQLEIYADDVKCAHGSTTGQLSMDELFYFQARGISAAKAKAMLARAFINDVLLKIEKPLLREYAMNICETYEVNLL
jgi:Fe-S cluster assembly protein SufD